MLKNSKKSDQFSSPTGPRPTQMVSVNFTDTTNQIRVSWPHNWLDIYEFIDTVSESTKFPPRVIRESDESETDNEIYNEELLRMQRSELHKISSRRVVLQITDVM